MILIKARYQKPKIKGNHGESRDIEATVTAPSIQLGNQCKFNDTMPRNVTGDLLNDAIFALQRYDETIEVYKDMYNKLNEKINTAK